MEKTLEMQYNGQPEKIDIKPLKSNTVEKEKVKPVNFIETPRRFQEIEKSRKPVKSDGIAIPARAAGMDHIVNRYGSMIEAAAKETSLDSALIVSVIKTESDGNATAVSHAGAKGLMQLANSKAGDYGVSDAFDPKQNIIAGSRFLKSLLNRFGSLPLALAAYNAGPGNVEKYGGIPPFKETIQYVERVIDHFETMRPKNVTKGQQLENR